MASGVGGVSRSSAQALKCTHVCPFQAFFLRVLIEKTTCLASKLTGCLQGHSSMVGGSSPVLDIDLESPGVA